MTNEDDAPAITVKERQTPLQAYQLTMTIENAPGPFGMVEGSAQYDVDNRQQCGARNPASGTVSRMTHMPPLQWRRVAENTYETIVYPDLLVDEDYFGNGVCHWKLMGASALLRATGDPSETRFLPAFDYDEIYEEKQKTLYLWSGYYPKAKSENFPEFGQTDLSAVPADKRNEFFSVTLTARKVQR